MEEKKNIELRSEKVRNIIGQIPSVWIRYGTLMIGLALLVLFLIATFIPYRETIPVRIRVKVIPQAEYVRADKNTFVSIKEWSDSVNTNSEKAFRGEIILNAKNDDYVERGDTLFVVLPEQARVYGTAEIAAVSLAKIEEGDKVLIDDAVAGSMQGRVSEIRPLPLSSNPSLRKIRIAFDEKTRWEKLIPESELQGKIVLSDVPLVTKFLQSVGWR
ncbi:HlyD family secretion protein [Seramator thermalis]|uniref:HlyD family secretion protein n=1 Tax=Seramator thermalis TaxID=2496270 RepID=UPI00101BCD39|nr:HlyD family secretion protein [Seramator thermalis]